MIKKDLHCFGKRVFKVIHQKEKISNIKMCFNFKFSANQFKDIFLMFLIFIMIICLKGCDNNSAKENDPAKVALVTEDNQIGIIAVDKLTDQAAIKKIALEAKNFQVRIAAVTQLSDQSLLYQIAEDENLVGWMNHSVREKAIFKLTNRSQLAKIALENKNFELRLAAMKKLTVQSYLYKPLLDNIDVEKEDRNVQIIYKLVKVFDTVPEERRLLLLTDILPVFYVLSDSEIVKYFGEIVVINIDWHSLKHAYSSDEHLKGGFMRGESLNCSIRLKKLSKLLSHSWSTNFPSTTPFLGFKSAEVNSSDLLKPVLDRLPQSLLEKIAKEGRDEDICNLFKTWSKRRILKE
jgi:hypothetical protein